MTEHLTFIDVETTGLDTQQHEIVDIWARRVRDDNLELVDEAGGLVLPEHLETASPEALAINGYDAARWAAEARPFADVWAGVLPLVHGADVVGHYVAFDLGFIDAECNRRGLVACNPRVAIDTKVLSRLFFQRGLSRSMKLDHLVEDLELDVGDAVAHSARGDVLRTIALYRRSIRL